jgi:hypothetical protein
VRPRAVAAGLVLAAAVTLPAAAGADACVQTQSMDGRISGCLQVGPWRSGAHTVVLEELPSFPTGAAVQRLPGDRTPLPREPRVSLSLDPAAGQPGSWVTITGRLRSSLHQRSQYPTVCWDGCVNGLQYGGPHIRWLSRREFRIRIRVPAAPWLEGGPPRVAPLVSGLYSIGVDCLVLARGCALAGSEGSAGFALRVRHTVAWCRTAASCGRLHVTPGAQEPAQDVRVSGYAPLVSVIGSDRPFLFGLQVRRGRPRGSEVVFGRRRGVVQIGHALLQVKAPPPFGALGPLAPLTWQTAGLAPISGDPAGTGTVAWCWGSTVGVDSGGRSTTYSTAAAAAPLRAEGLAWPGMGAPACAAAATVGGTIVADFSVAPVRYGAPPFQEAALTTSDGGATWAPLPVPPGAATVGFGGFRSGPGGPLEAVFSSTVKGGTRAYPILDPYRPLAETSADGRTWSSVPLGCPSAGPCVTLGAFLPSNCAMTGEYQPLLRSRDDGLRWTEAAVPAPIDACADAELATLSGGRLLLVNTLSPFPLTISADGGRRWREVGLPPAPRPMATPGQPGGLTLLPDGALLLARPRSAWQLLRPGARRWCAVAGSPSGALLVSPAVVGDQLWWVSGSTAAPRLASLAASSVSC